MVHSRIYCCGRMLSVCSICKDTPYIYSVNYQVRTHNDRIKSNYYYNNHLYVHSRITQIYTSMNNKT